MINRTYLVCLTALACFACAPAPELGTPLTEAERSAPFPDLLPLATLLNTAPAPRGSEATAADLAGRVANLRARAALLRGPVIDPATRATMRGGVARTALR